MSRRRQRSDGSSAARLIISTPSVRNAQAQQQSARKNVLIRAGNNNTRSCLRVRFSTAPGEAYEVEDLFSIIAQDVDESDNLASDPLLPIIDADTEEPATTTYHKVPEKPKRQPVSLFKFKKVFLCLNRLPVSSRTGLATPSSNFHR